MMASEIFEVTSCVLTAFSIASCACVLIISHKIFRRTKKEYAWITGFNITIELLYAVFSGIGMTVAYTTPTQFLMATYNRLLYDQSATVVDIVFVLNFYFTNLVLPNNVIHFWYRYNMLCRGVTWSRKKYCLIFAVVAVIDILIYLPYSSTRSRETEESWEIFRMVSDGSIIPRHVFFEINDPVFAGGMVYNTFCLLLSYLSMCFFQFKIYRKMKEHSQRAVNTTWKTQQRIVLVMGLQGMYPAVLFLFPNLFLTALIADGIELKQLSFVVKACGQSMPIINSLTVLLLIPSYSREIFGGKESSNDRASRRRSTLKF
ncbi:unnamed protein product [Bursaphelenchus xylophilus]|uniref:(pine wood nematode) hypothetical protein n=1 Tax=Bursaphelenchus xylophilus TaxID=6326 RepID=A0A1I7SCP0_BURXY|nr:unnamed protein product [Bursaphelenchus xylophilus]CAG9093769.1 unnamed protein product [Bursaphelenchus xylophilus]